MGCISDGQEAEYREPVDHFVAWCGITILILNVNKTEDIIVDFRRTRNNPNTVFILGQMWRWWRNTDNWEFTWTATRTSVVSPLELLELIMHTVTWKSRAYRGAMLDSVSYPRTP